MRQRASSCELEADARLGALVADERKIKQVMLNLLSNAVKFTPEGGRVDVRAMPADGAVEISVTDTGIGIAPEDQEPIFEEFRQVGGDYARKREGTGLGPDPGPQVRRAARRPPLGEEPGRPGLHLHLLCSGATMAGELILIVEDNEKNRKLERDILQFHGYRTAEAENAEDGLALAAGHAARPGPHGHPAPAHERDRGAAAPASRRADARHPGRSR